MCGICGELRLEGGPPVAAGTIETMASMLAHRGPDDSGCFLPEHQDVGLGHCRLSVIDLPGGAQPMANEDGSITVVFNGEIYNFAELRDDLVSRGHTFRTRSDTEVIVHQYEEDGPECVNRFNGMFAFVIWDEREKKLFLARDRLGIKPLYYASAAGRFLFASEIRPIIAALPQTPGLDMASMWAYLAVQYAPAPNTLFQGIRELKPGTRLVADAAGVKEETYWRPPHEVEPLSGAEAEEAILALLEDSVKKRLIADVPLGAFLSGGIDSTALVALMRRHVGEGLKTFSVDFDAELGADAVNETRWSRLASKTFATDHHPLTVSAKDAIDCLPLIAERLDDLISDPAVIPTYLVSRFARDRVTVALSGEGGDELFAGYQRHRLAALVRYYRLCPGALSKLLFEAPAARVAGARRVRKALAALGAAGPAARHLAWLMVMPGEVVDALIGAGYGGREVVESRFGKFFEGQSGAYDLDRVLRADLSTWLPDDLLTKVDRASMAVGLECRVPFLDHRMVELCLRVPASEKAGLMRSKTVFKRAVGGLVPDEIIARKKAGFTLPLDAWFRKELREMMLDMLGPDRLSKEGIFDPDAVGALVNEHLSGRENQGHGLFSLLLFQLWHDSIKKIERAQ